MPDDGPRRSLNYPLFACLIFLVFCACSPTGKCNTAENKQSILHILFIGNSYTYVNDLPGTLTQLACSGGHKIETDMAAQGGWTLADHAASTQTLDKLVQKKWDLVILQEQSEIPAMENYRAQSMYPAVRSLVSKIRGIGPEPLLFITWAHSDGLPSAGYQSYFDMQNQLDVGYKEIAKELGVQVVPVGEAWMQGRLQLNPIDLWQADGSHPNEKGTYLAACVFYATIFQQSPEGLSYRGSLSQETALTLQTLAANTVLTK